MSHRIIMATATTGAALLAAGCGAGEPQAVSTTATGTGDSSSSAAPASPPAAVSPTAAATTPALPPVAAPPAGPTLCKAEGLSAATNPAGGGAAGSVYMTLSLTNTGSEPCILRGFAGVSLVADAAGTPIGAPAARDESTAPTDVLLAPGQAGAAVLRYTQAGNYAGCTKADAAGYRIYPPEDTASLFLAQATRACSNADIVLLTIGAFQPA